MIKVCISTHNTAVTYQNVNVTLYFIFIIIVIVVL